MNYDETIDYLFHSTPLFQHIGADAYKEGLQNTQALDAFFAHPHTQYRTIHVGGTNGKGSCSHTLAAILQCAGYKVGLYTSPHLIDFRERIRINGTPIGQDYVIRFVEQYRRFFEPLHPSFFELATAMAFRYFADMHVDVAVVEVGLGGLLDCTNIIHPDLSIITNISLDHTQFLGHTLHEIATQKAGIIKPGIPVVIGEATPQTKPVFADKAGQVGAPIYFAEEQQHLLSAMPNEAGWLYQTKEYANLQAELGGFCQPKNTQTILTALPLLSHFHISEPDVRRAFSQVCQLTGLMGRWQTIGQNPRIVCDTGHNVGGIQYIAKQLNSQPCEHLHIIIGMVSDKDIRGVLHMLPPQATYYFTQASVQRAMPATQLAAIAHETGLHGSTHASVGEALQEAMRHATPNDLIFVGGSTFIVADLLKTFH